MSHSISPDPRFVNRDEVSSRIRTILVVDDDPRFLASARGWLEDRGFHVICAETRKGALASAASTAIDVVLVDYRLRGRENGLLLASHLCNEHGIPFVLVSGFLSTRLTVQAMRSGAYDVLDKPVTAKTIVAAISRAIAGDRASPDTPLFADLDRIPSSDEDSPPEHLAHLVLRACDAKHDPKKLSRFARASVVSSSAFRAACNLCGVTPRQACDLGRVLRAISLSVRDNSPIISHFSVGDPRTAVGLMWRAGLDPKTRQIELHAFLRGQRVVKLPSEFVRALGHLASHSPLFIPTGE